MNATERTRTLIAVDAVKDAALYAEWVVPVGVALKKDPSETPSTEVLFDKLLPTEVKQNSRYTSLLRRLIDRPVSASHGSESLTAELFELGRLSYSLYLERKDSYAFLEKRPHKHSAEWAPDPFLTSMLRLDLIDTSKLRWNDVFAVRDDPQAHRKLRRLRLLFEENYAGKSLSYIEDDINRRIEDYQHVIKDWQFDTRTGIFEQLLSSKVFPSLLAGSVAALLVGSPVVATVGALAGLSLELGRATLEYAKRRHKLHRMVRDLPVGYLIDVKRRTE